MRPMKVPKGSGGRTGTWLPTHSGRPRRRLGEQVEGGEEAASPLLGLSPVLPLTQPHFNLGKREGQDFPEDELTGDRARRRSFRGFSLSTLSEFRS